MNIASIASSDMDEIYQSTPSQDNLFADSVTRIKQPSRLSDLALKPSINHKMEQLHTFLEKGEPSRFIQEWDSCGFYVNLQENQTSSLQEPSNGVGKDSEIPRCQGVQRKMLNTMLTEKSGDSILHSFYINRKENLPALKHVLTSLNDSLKDEKLMSEYINQKGHANNLTALEKNAGFECPEARQLHIKYGAKQDDGAKQDASLCSDKLIYHRIFFQETEESDLLNLIRKIRILNSSSADPNIKHNGLYVLQKAAMSKFRVPACIELLQNKKIDPGHMGLTLNDILRVQMVKVFCSYMPTIDVVMLHRSNLPKKNIDSVKIITAIMEAGFLIKSFKSDEDMKILEGMVDYKLERNDITKEMRDEILIKIYKASFKAAKARGYLSLSEDSVLYENLGIELNTSLDTNLDIDRKRL